MRPRYAQKLGSNSELTRHRFPASFDVNDFLEILAFICSRVRHFIIEYYSRCGIVNLEARCTDLCEWLAASEIVKLLRIQSVHSVQVRRSCFHRNRFNYKTHPPGNQHPGRRTITMQTIKPSKWTNGVNRNPAYLRFPLRKLRCQRHDNDNQLDRNGGYKLKKLVQALQINLTFPYN